MGLSLMFHRMTGTSDFDIYYYPTSKFKTTTIRIFFKGSLNERIEEKAILPSLLKRGSKRFPTLKEISRNLEALYGSALSMDIAKMRDMQVFVASLDVVNSSYLKGEKDLLFRVIDLLNDVLTHPVLEDGAFPKLHFEQEKKNLERYVRSVIDEKAVYTHLRLVEEMFRGEPFGNYEWGRLDRISRLDRYAAYDAYQDLFRSAPVDVYIIGRLTGDEERKLPNMLLPLKDRSQSMPAKPLESPANDGQDVIVEEQANEQSKMEMGFRADIGCGDDDYYALSLYNAILGGGSYSKLFKQVREEAGLSYYIHSSFDKLKGFLFVGAGIDTQNFDKTMGMIQSCMDEMAGGRISDDEISNAKHALTTSLRSIPDSPGQIVEYNLATRTAGREPDVDKVVKIIQGTNKDRIAGVSRLITKGKTFFLKGTANSNEHDTPRQ